jgi:RimJ/RimL family protein N-acetyltransferase
MTSYSLRPATSADSATLLQWRNDARTREWARTTLASAQSEHEDWLTRLLADPSRLLFVLQRERQDVASVRLDLSDVSDDSGDARQAEISITVAPEVRGQGVGSQALAATAAYAADSLPRVRHILAVVNRGNEASVRLFTKAGYHPRVPTDPTWLELILPL